MSKNILKIRKCSENGGRSERVAGQGAPSEEVVWVSAPQWNKPLEDPREECPR